MLLITGATGHVGRPLVENLLARGSKVRAVTRDRAQAGLPDEADVVVGDFATTDWLDEALAGVTAIFVNPAAVGDGLGALLDAAAAQGVRHVMLLSSGAIRDDLYEQSDPLAGWHLALEHAVRASGIPFTFLRPFEFASNVVSQWAQQIRYSGAVHEAYPQACGAIVDDRDIAAVAAEVLDADAPAGEVYLITGPESVTREQMVQIVGQELHRDVAFVTIPHEAALEAMTAHGLPHHFAEAVLAMRAASLHWSPPITDTVQRVTGTPARSFRTWAHDHAELLG